MGCSSIALKRLASVSFPVLLIDDEIHVVGFPRSITDKAHPPKEPSGEPFPRDHHGSNAAQLPAFFTQQDPKFRVGSVTRPPRVKPRVRKEGICIHAATEQLLPLRRQGGEFPIRGYAPYRVRHAARFAGKCCWTDGVRSAANPSILP